MPVRSRYQNDKQTRAVIAAEAGNVITFPNGQAFKVVKTIVAETPELKAARLECELKEAEQARACNARYNKTEARKVSRKTYDKTPAGKVIRTRQDKERLGRVKERKLAAPFIGIDTEGVNVWSAAWIEDGKRNCTPCASSATFNPDNLTPDETLYVPQKITVLAAGNDDEQTMLCHKTEGKGEDAPGLSSLEMMKWLCDLPERSPADAI